MDEYQIETWDNQKCGCRLQVYTGPEKHTLMYDRAPWCKRAHEEVWLFLASLDLEMYGIIVTAPLSTKGLPMRPEYAKAWTTDRLADDHQVHS